MNESESRVAAEAANGATGGAAAGADGPGDPTTPDVEPAAAMGEPADAAPDVADNTPESPSLADQLAERTEDLQRLQAEYVNYKRRVDRDRDLARRSGVEAVTLELLPVLDSIDAARGHGELSGGFKLVADELEKVAAKFSLAAYGEVGDEFDPQMHDALMQMSLEGDHTEPIVAQVMQRGYRIGERIVRHARVAVADPN